MEEEEEEEEEGEGEEGQTKVCFCLEFMGVLDFLWFGMEISAPLV